MRICHCTLGGTIACAMCPNNALDSSALPSSIPRTRYLAPVKIITEEYDGKGNLIRRVIEEKGAVS